MSPETTVSLALIFGFAGLIKVVYDLFSGTNKNAKQETEHRAKELQLMREGFQKEIQSIREEFRKEIQALRTESSAETFTTRSGIDKANMKLDEVCRSLSEQRVDIKAIDLQLKDMSKKQLEHDMRMDALDGRVTAIEEYIDRGVLGND